MSESAGKHIHRLGRQEPALRLVRNKRLGKYRLQKRIAKGGYCEIWKARDTVEGIWVALKIPHADMGGKRDNETILREVRLVAQLRHPHIMPVKNADIIDGHAILATELSSGTLEDCSVPMGVRRIFSIMRQVLDGLSFAHHKRMVHCDVTPGNIFLFENGRAALGDFGIGVQVKGRMVTVDDFGTPGYVAPEQAYGRPTYRSDCFSVGLILYEYLTGYLPRWPFYWPPKRLDRLRSRTSAEFVRFVKTAIEVDPEKRFGDAGQMLSAMDDAMPGELKKKLLRHPHHAVPDWQSLRKKAFVQRYGRIFTSFHQCVDCGQPVAESMQCCPWCGSGRNRFDDCTRFTHVCRRCHKGVSPEWLYCPWCYGAGFIRQESSNEKIAYQDRCEHCGDKMMHFMKYCPWCRRKRRKKWQIWPFPEVCGSCGWSVDTDYWHYCPWCEEKLV